MLTKERLLAGEKSKYYKKEEIIMYDFLKKNIVLICFIAYSILSTLCCGILIRSNERANQYAREYRAQYDRARETLDYCRGEVGQIRDGLSNDVTTLRDVIKRLREISASVENMENKLNSDCVSRSNDLYNQENKLANYILYEYSSNNE